MSVQIIADRFVKKEHFQDKNLYIAIDQAGMFMGQPEPNRNNKGDMRLVTSGGLNNELKTMFFRSQTTHASATVGELYDSSLTPFFGNGFFSDWNLTWVTGANVGWSDKVASWSQDTYHMIPSNAFDFVPGIGDEFILSLDPKQIQCEVVCLTSGGPGVGQFKISLLRSSYTGIDSNGVFGDPITITPVGVTDKAWALVQMANDNLVAFHTDSGGYVYASISTTGGWSWEDPVQINPDSSGDTFRNCKVLADGVVLAIVNSSGGSLKLYYSYDHGETWEWPVMPLNITAPLRDLVELPSGYFLGIYDSAGSLYCRSSRDRGYTWSNAVTIASTTGDQENGTLCLNKFGDVICAYESTEDGTGHIEIKSKYSTDGGATWSSVVEISGAAIDQIHPMLIMAHDGEIWCNYGYDDTEIRMRSSRDNGFTFSSGTIYASYDEGGTDVMIEPRPALIDGHMIYTCFQNNTDGDLQLMVSREKEFYTGASNIPIPVAQIPWVGFCGFRLQWLGNNAVIGDTWTFKTEYEYHISNVIDESRHKVFRSTKDNVDLFPEIRTGDDNSERFLVDGVAVFDSNVVTMDFKMDDYGTWAAPSITTNLDFQLAVGAVDAVDGNYFQDTSLLANYVDHELIGVMVEFTSGNSDGLAYRIADNMGSWIRVTTDHAIDAVATNTFKLYGSKVAATMTENLDRYMHFGIDAHKTPDGYYQLGTVIMGKTITLDRAWMPGYGKDLVDGVQYIRSKHGDIYPVVRQNNKRIFTVKWNAQETVLSELISLKNYIQGRNICLIPDSSDLTDIYLVKMIGNIDVTNYHQDKHNFSVTFEEV